MGKTMKKITDSSNTTETGSFLPWNNGGNRMTAKLPNCQTLANQITVFSFSYVPQDRPFGSSLAVEQQFGRGLGTPLPNCYSTAKLFSVRFPRKKRTHHTPSHADLFYHQEEGCTTYSRYYLRFLLQYRLWVFILQCCSCSRDHRRGSKMNAPSRSIAFFCDKKLANYDRRSIQQFGSYIG